MTTQEREREVLDYRTALTTALDLVGHTQEPPPIPQGKLGGCVACGRTVASHFLNGEWIGCLKGEAATVYVLMPVHAAGIVAPTNGTPRPPRTARPGRQFKEPRYHSLLHHRASVAKLGLSERRRQVLELLHGARAEGVDAVTLTKALKVPNSSVHSTLNWLRAHKLAETREHGE